MATKTINTILNLKDKFTGKMKKVADQTNQNARQMKLLKNHIDGFKQTAVSGFTQVAKKAGVVGAAIMGIGAAAVSINGSVDFINSYGASLNQLQASTGATTAQMAEMKSQLTKLYSMNIGESWDDLADAMQTARQVTGQTGAALQATTANAIMYRDIFKADIPESIKTVDTMTKNFGITSSQAYNLLAQGAQKGLDKSGELLDTANEYSVYFKTLGFSADEMFNIFGEGLAKGAFNLDKVGDSMKEFGIRSKDGSKSSAEGFKALGLNAQKMTAAFAKGGPTAKKAFSQVMDAMQKVKDPAKLSAASVNLFGTQAEDMEKTVIMALGSARKQFDMTRNTMQAVGNVKYNNVGAAFEGIKRQIETGLLVPIADKLLPKLNDFSAWINANMPEIRAAIDDAFSTGIDIIEKLADAVAWAKQNMDWLLPVVTGLTAAFVAQKIVMVVTTSFQTMAKVTQGLTVAQWALNLAMNANPFGLIATAIGLVIAAGVYLWKNWDTVKLKAQQLWTSITNVWNNIKTSIMGAVSNVSNWLGSFPLGQTFLNTVRGVVDSVKRIFNGIIDFFRSVFKGDWEGAWNAIVEAFKGEFDLVATYAKAPINYVIDLINGLIDKVNSISIDVPDWLGGGTFGVSIPKIPHFALGTSYFQGGVARINERGGEIVNLPGGSQVIPADKSERMINNSRGDIKINIIVQGNLIGEEEEVNRIMNKAVPRILLALGNA